MRHFFLVLISGRRCNSAAEAEARDGVVDADLKVHGLDNLYVVSNGVFPNLGAVNPTLTLTALALKLGDHLVAQGGAA